MLEYLLTLEDTTTEAHPDKTAAQALCDMLPMGVMQSDSEAAFAEAAEQCLMAFPDGRGRELAEYVWKIRRRLEFSHSNHLHMLVGAARTDEADGLALYHDGWEKAVTLQNLGEYPWGYPFTAQDVSYYHSDGFNTYRAVCADGTVLSGFNWDKVEILDIASLTGICTENPTFATPDGVHVGMKRSEVPGAPKSGDFYIAAQKDYLQLVIHFDGDTVSALELVQGMDAAVYSGGSSGNTDASGSSEPDGVKLSYSDVTLSASNEESYALSLENLPADASVNYSSDDTAIATVSSDGVVKAVGHGTASISVKITLGGETRTLKCIVRVM